MTLESTPEQPENNQITTKALSTTLSAITYMEPKGDNSREVEIAFANGMYINLGSNTVFAVGDLNLEDTITLTAPEELFKKNNEYLGLVGIKFSRRDKKGKEVVIVKISVPNNHIKKISPSA